MTDSELPIDLKRQLEDVREQDSSGYDMAGFLRTVPDDRPEECPDCGADLSPSTVYVDQHDDPMAVQLVCHGTHAGGTIATYIYEVATDELYLEREAESEPAFTDWDES